jgi:hypothetical protein
VFRLDSFRVLRCETVFDMVLVRVGLKCDQKKKPTDMNKGSFRSKESCQNLNRKLLNSLRKRTIV